MEFIVLLLFGLLVGSLGAMVGSGGGFLVAPFLLFATGLSPQSIAGTSLVVVLLSNLSATSAYHRQKKIDYSLAKLLIVSILPGTVIGVALSRYVTPVSFEFLLSAIFVLLAVLLFKNIYLRVPHFIPHPIHKRTRMRDRNEDVFDYTVSLRRTAFLSFMVGIVSAITGIGGGILCVPIMIMILGVPTKIAAATMRFITVFTSLIAVVLFSSFASIDYEIAIPLGIGVVISAQLGAHLMDRSDAIVVRQVIASLLLLAGILVFSKIFF